MNAYQRRACARELKAEAKRQAQRDARFTHAETVAYRVEAAFLRQGRRVGVEFNPITGRYRMGDRTYTESQLDRLMLRLDAEDAALVNPDEKSC